MVAHAATVFTPEPLIAVKVVDSGFTNIFAVEKLLEVFLIFIMVLRATPTVRAVMVIGTFFIEFLTFVFGGVFAAS